MLYKLFLFAGFICLWDQAAAQEKKIAGGRIFYFSSSNTCFPETGRLTGYSYDSQFYDYNTHYRDSSVLVVVPDKWKPLGDSLDIVFWFHGWHNNIDTALSYYHLADQFIASHKNAVLVLAESAKNAPDSYGGKLEHAAVFKALVGDLFRNLQKFGLLNHSAKPGNIILAGHSGAYRVIASILQNGGMLIKETDLFDALYSETGKFMQWLNTDRQVRFVNIYTNKGGGTDEVSIKMMQELKTRDIPFLFYEENKLDTKLLAQKQIYFIHSEREHNDIIFNPDQFRLLLESSPFLSSVKQ
jgi:hypothetical protein